MPGIDELDDGYRPPRAAGGRRTARAGGVGAWLMPSLIAAPLAALIAGLVEGAGTAYEPIGAVAAAGFSSLIAIPAGLGLALLVRGLWAAWRPARLVDSLVERGGAAPRLAAWIGVLAVAAFVLAWVSFNAVRVLARETSFKPVVVAMAMPIIVVATAGVLVVLSRPVVDVVAALVRWLDGRVARRLGRPVVTPGLIAVAAIGLAVLLPVLGWLVTIQPRVGHLDTSIARHPVLLVAALAAIHPLWRRLVAPSAWLRRGIAAVVVAATAATCATAVYVRARQPALMLELWGDFTIAGATIDRLYDLEAVRSEIKLATFRPVERPGARHPDVVLITIDTVRADRTPLNGGPAEMPVLGALGQRGATFTWAFSPGNVTRRSIPSLALGLNPQRVRGRVAGWAMRLDPRHVVLAERFAAAGYDTAGFFCCESFWGAQHKLGLNRGLAHVYIEHDGALLAKATRQWLLEREASHPDQPLFLWVHFLEPHNWLADLAGRERDIKNDADRRRAYDKTLTQVDRFLGDILGAFGDRPPDDHPLVVVTSDHGEALGDHGQPTHSTDLYNSQIRVPLAIAGPGVKARRIDEPFGLVDLTPTLLDLAGFVPPGMPHMDGRSRAGLVGGTVAPDRDGGYAFSVQIKDRSVAVGARALVVGRWKIIETPRGDELYDLRADPDERRNLVKSNPTDLARMRALLDERDRIDRIPPF